MLVTHIRDWRSVGACVSLQEGELLLLHSARNFSTYTHTYIPELHLMCIKYLMQNHLRHKKVWPSKVESYLEVNA